MQFHVIPPHPKLSKLIMHLLVTEFNGGESRIPAGLSASMMFFVRGKAKIVTENGDLLESDRFFLRGPYMTPVHAVYDSETICISFCFIPGMLQAALGLSVADLVGQQVPVQDVVDPLRVEQLLQQIGQDCTIQEMVQLFQEFLLDILDHRPKQSLANSFLAAHKKMFIPLLDLSLYFGIGQRQLERRVRELFGLNLRDVRRVTRFGLTLPRIIDQSASWGDLTRIAQESGYYDQAHMHREFTELAGISPAQLLQKIASNDPGYWLYRLNQSDFKNLFIAVD
ncbi:MAG: AraC family transcriptional regulator [Burkholderiales bacterium]|nr:AraC family transcriptional regulator [Burkholderiales bacterium]